MKLYIKLYLFNRKLATGICLGVIVYIYIYLCVCVCVCVFSHAIWSNDNIMRKYVFVSAVGMARPMINVYKYVIYFLFLQ